MKLIDIRYEVQGEIAVVTLDRQDVRNAYSVGMLPSLLWIFDQAEKDDAIRCVILTGAGAAFSAGGDLQQMKERSGMFEGDAIRLRSSYIRGIQQIPLRLSRFDKPVIAAINGPAIGAGLDLACMCDIRIASDRARFGSTFVKIGLIPGDGGAYILARTIGYPRALEMILTGRIIDPPKALALGLVHEVVPHTELLERAHAVAQEIAAQAPIAVRLSKAAASQSWDMTFEQAMTLAASYQGIAQTTADHEEGVDAMLEKRPPLYKNK